MTQQGMCAGLRALNAAGRQQQQQQQGSRDAAEVSAPCEQGTNQKTSRHKGWAGMRLRSCASKRALHVRLQLLLVPASGLDLETLKISVTLLLSESVAAP